MEEDKLQRDERDARLEDHRFRHAMFLKWLHGESLDRPDPFLMVLTIRDEQGNIKTDADAVVRPYGNGGVAQAGRVNTDGRYEWLFDQSQHGQGAGIRISADKYNTYRCGFVMSKDDPEIHFDDGLSDVSLTVYVPPSPPKPQYKQPEAYTLGELLAVRGAMWTHPLPNNYGPRPYDPTNITATCYLDCYTAEEQDYQLKSLRQKGYTHVVCGPLVDGGYHGMYPAWDYRQQFDAFLNLLERFWSYGLIPIVFLHLDNQSYDDFVAMYDPLIRGNERAAKLMRFIVPSGWEPTRYDWSSNTWAMYGAWGRSVLPNAVIGLHTVSDVDAPVGTDENGDDNGKDNAEGWRRVVPNIHCWLVQTSAFENPDGHDDPNHPEKTNYENWLELWDETKEKSYTNRFRNGYAGWPTNSAMGDIPIRIINAECCSYWVTWQGRAAAEGDQWGDASIQGKGADGYLDGGTLAVKIHEPYPTTSKNIQQFSVPPKRK